MFFALPLQVGVDPTLQEPKSAPSNLQKCNPVIRTYSSVPLNHQGKGNQWSMTVALMYVYQKRNHTHNPMDVLILSTLTAAVGDYMAAR